MIITEVNRLFEIKITTLMLVVRGVVQVLDLNVVSAAGIGHIILGVSLVMILLHIVTFNKTGYRHHCCRLY